MRVLWPAILMLMLFSCTLSRRLIFNAPDYRDQFRFQSAELQPSSSAFEWKRPEHDPDLGQQLHVLPTVFGLGMESMESYLDRSATLAFMIIRNDTILYERYFEGMGPEDPMTSFSVAKTFIGSLIGIAIGEGAISSMDDPVVQYLPDFPLADITIRQLMNHTSGVRYPAEGWLYYTPQLDRIFEGGLERWAPPGTTFRYENGNSQMLSMVLEAATQMPVEDYLESRIWSKLGTQGPVNWSTDDNGTPKAFCCLNARARDFALFGRLMQRHGEWDGQQIVPREFFDEGVKGDTINGQFIRYKHQMWLEGESAVIYLAAGLYGQYLYIYPPKNILIVRFSHENLHLHAAWSEFFQTIIAQL